MWYDRDQMIWDGNHKPKSSLKQAVGQSSPKKAEDFEVSEKIVLQRIAKKLTASLDTNQYYAHSSVVIVKPAKEFETRYILSILNSHFIDLWLRAKSSNISLNVGTLKHIPIPNATIEQQNELCLLVDKMLSLNHDLQAKRARFIRRLQDNMPDIKIKGTLETFDTLDFAGFVSELKKQKIKLSLAQQDEWEEYFGQYKTDCEELKSSIATTDAEINNRVYALYGLTDDEIQLIEQ